MIPFPIFYRGFSIDRMCLMLTRRRFTSERFAADNCKFGTWQSGGYASDVSPLKLDESLINYKITLLLKYKQKEYSQNISM